MRRERSVVVLALGLALLPARSRGVEPGPPASESPGPPQAGGRDDEVGRVQALGPPVSAAPGTTSPPATSGPGVSRAFPGPIPGAAGSTVAERARRSERSYGYSFIMLGDQLPVSARQLFPGAPTGPPNPPDVRRASALVPSVRGFNIAENQSPQPQDRVFYSFNYFA
ncbi:MAG TPA: hypothetical protein VF590_21680, partial [Isosphaeraceae bacterium]